MPKVRCRFLFPLEGIEYRASSSSNAASKICLRFEESSRTFWRDCKIADVQNIQR